MTDIPSETDKPSESPSEPVTLPKKLPNAPEGKKAGESRGAAAKTGIATRYWLELMPYPVGSVRSLWLFVNDDWRHLDNPDPGTQASVQDAFCRCSERLEVLVWYSEDIIEGLIVKTK
ncbi:MAG TPA: hypothetical protein VN414_12920 [Methanosarcina sp.]|nr:hypothetical protein [Methanosarcina sp.]